MGARHLGIGLNRWAVADEPVLVASVLAANVEGEDHGRGFRATDVRDHYDRFAGLARDWRPRTRVTIHLTEVNRLVRALCTDGLAAQLTPGPRRARSFRLLPGGVEELLGVLGGAADWGFDEVVFVAWFAAVYGAVVSACARGRRPEHGELGRPGCRLTPRQVLAQARARTEALAATLERELAAGDGDAVPAAGEEPPTRSPAYGALPLRLLRPLLAQAPTFSALPTLGVDPRLRPELLLRARLSRARAELAVLTELERALPPTPPGMDARAEGPPELADEDPADGVPSLDLWDDEAFAG